MFFKNKRAEAASWSLIIIVAIVAVVGIVLMTTNGSLTGKATAPGTGGGTTDATGLARECIVDLYGSAGQIPKSGVSKASVDDAVAECVKARGGQIVTGGTCDPNSADGCSNTFSSEGQDPDASSTWAIYDVLDSTGTSVVGEMYVTTDGQVIGSEGCKPGDVICEPRKMSCAREVVSRYIPGPFDCPTARMMMSEILFTCAGSPIAVRECPEPPVVIDPK